VVGDQRGERAELLRETLKRIRDSINPEAGTPHRAFSLENVNLRKMCVLHVHSTARSFPCCETIELSNSKRAWIWIIKTDRP